MNSNAQETASVKKAPWPWYAGAVLLFCADRLLKTLALSGAVAGAHGTVEFTLFMNHGIAFSLPVPSVVFWPFAVVALLALVYAFTRALRHAPMTAGILFFILAGAASNLLDRAKHDATVDYLLFFSRSAVNIADGMIVGGLLVLALRDKKEELNSTGAPTPE